MSDDLKAIAESLERIEKLLGHQAKLQILQMRERSINDKRDYDRSVREIERRIDRELLDRGREAPRGVSCKLTTDPVVANMSPQEWGKLIDEFAAKSVSQVSQVDDLEISHITIEESE